MAPRDESRTRELGPARNFTLTLCRAILVSQFARCFPNDAFSMRTGSDVVKLPRCMNRAGKAAFCPPERFPIGRHLGKTAQ